jgi:gluconate 2-dehydrogenase gamma chain
MSHGEPQERLTAEPEGEGGDDALSRRVFVQRLGFMSGGVVLLGGASCTPRERAPAVPDAQVDLTTSHLTFTDAEWAILVAAVDRMLPGDEDPGGVEAGVPEYIDRMLVSPLLSQMKTNFLSGLPALDRRAQRLFKAGFAHATPVQQDEVLAIFKNSPEKSGEARWYEILLVLCLEGFLGDPSYGGNRGEVGWKLVGFSLVGRNVKGDPLKGYDGQKQLDRLTCGGGHGC